MSNLSDAANVLFSILSRESQPKALGKLFAVPLGEKFRAGIEPEANIVTVEQNGMHPLRVQLSVEEVRDRAFAGPAESGEPNHTAFVPVEPLTVRPRHMVWMPRYV